MSPSYNAVAAVLCVLVTIAYCIPPYKFPADWTAEEYLEFLMKEQEQRVLRPLENRYFNTDGQGIGAISGIDVNSSGVVHIFHRGNRVWDMNTFSEGDVLSDELKEPIGEPTILALDPVTGRLIGGTGDGLFNMPHGLKIDHDDNIWVTDVGRHQVFRIPHGGNTPDLTLGEPFVPGPEDNRFCKPTDVAVASNGDFFVSDGYCNRRIMKFDKTGKLLTKIGMADTDYEPSSGPDPYAFNTPHSLTLVEELDIVCVADRENKRALCYNAGINSDRPLGAFNRTLIPQGEMGKIYSIYYNKADKDVVAAGEINRIPFRMSDTMYYPARAFTFGLNGQQKVEWAYITPEIAQRGPSLIHALCTSQDGKDFYLADVQQKKVYKYTMPFPGMTAE